MEVAMNIDNPLDDEQLKVVGLVGVVVLAMVAAPMLLTPSDEPEMEPNNGTVTTPDQTTFEEVNGPNRGSLGGLNAIPASHSDESGPTVQSSAGAQTMRVETTTVDGEPALNLTDDRTHDGRWVSVPTDWFNRTQGEVPEVARIAHETNRTYTESIRVRGNAAAFYVRGFSTNTVTFGGELVIEDQPAINGTRHSYELGSMDNVDDVSINVTGETNEEWDNETATGVLAGGSTSLSVGGSLPPVNASGGDPVLRVTPSGGSVSESPGSDTSHTFSDTPSAAGKFVYAAENANLDGSTESATIELVIDGSVVTSTELTLDPGAGVFDRHVTFPTTDIVSDATIRVVDNPGGNIVLTSSRQLELINNLDSSVNFTADTGESADFTGLSDGQTVEKTMDVGLSTTSISNDAAGGVFDVELVMKERTETTDPVVEVNGHETGHTGTLADGETVSLNASSSWLQDGTNNVTVFVGDGSVTSGPEPQVDVEYRHDIESRRTVQYESEALSESYNISKTYSTARENATLTIPHARTVVSMRSLEYRLNETGSYGSVPQSASNLSGTTLTVDVSELAGDPVTEGTTVEIRSVGSRVDAHNAEISVLEATPVGFDMASRIALDSWGSDSYLGVGETPQGGLVYYADNESYSAESDYVELYGDGRQQLYAPNASSGSEVTLNTLSARVSPEQNSMRVRVPESANQTNTEFVVEPASVVGDAWTAEYVAGTDGQWYAVVDSAGEELGAAEKPDAIEVDRDDVGLVSIVSTDPPSASTDQVGGGVFATVTTGNLPSLLVLFGGVGMLFVAGTRPRSSRDAIDAFARSVGGLVERVPRVGGPVGSAIESGLSSAGSGLVSVGENRLLTGAVAAAVAVAAAQAGLFTVGSETGAILAVAGIAVGSLWLLRESGEFTTARWIAIVGVAGVVALQGLGEGDLLSEIVNSDAFLILVLIGGYALIQLVREYRANNSPDDNRPEIVIGGNLGSDNDNEGGSP